jgi:hypothetical protein
MENIYFILPASEIWPEKMGRHQCRLPCRDEQHKENYRATVKLGHIVEQASLNSCLRTHTDRMMNMNDDGLHLYKTGFPSYFWFYLTKMSG